MYEDLANYKFNSQFVADNINDGDKGNVCKTSINARRTQVSSFAEKRTKLKHKMQSCLRLDKEKRRPTLEIQWVR